MTGRKPLPAKLIDPADHKKSKEEIEARVAVESGLKTTSFLKCPRFLSPDAQKEWRRVMKLYKQMDSDILCDLDRMAMIAYCEAVSMYNKAQETWARYGQIVAANPEAQRVLDKCRAVMKEQTKIITSLSEQLCLTPVGRARMGMGSVRKEPSAIDKFLAEEEDDV